MAKRIINLQEIRNQFTKLIDSSGKYSSVSNWLPSIDGDFQNTFTLEGTNPIGGGSSKGEINRITNFDQPIDSSDINLLRYNLFLYCTQKGPYSFDRSNFLINDRSNNGLLFNQEVEDFLKNYQTGKGQNSQTRGLTADIVRTYRGTKLKGSIEDENSVQSLINYSQIPNGDYQKNVAGVLGKVTYDSTVKHRLYSDLLASGYIPNLEKTDPTKTISDLATNLENGEFDLFLDTNGGPNSRAFPVVCVYTKDISGKNIQDILPGANNIIESKLFRKPNGDKQLVTPIKSGKEKNFIEYKIRESGYSAYCIIYDFTKIIVLEPSLKNDYTLGILKIALSLFSTIQTKEVNISEFETLYKKSSAFLDNSFGDEIEELFFKILYPTKHSKETAYLTNKSEASLKAKFSKTFKLEITNLANSIVSVGDKILSIFKEQIQQNFQFKNYSKNEDYKITLHFDNFYNLLAVTTRNTKPQSETPSIDETSPFVLEDYKTEFSTGDLIAKFYKEPPALPEFANGEYKFKQTFALNHDIICITDFFIQETYKNLDSTSEDFVYESSDVEQQKKDSVLTQKPFKILDLINSRLGINLNKNDYFFVSSNKVYLKKEVVRKIDLNELTFTFKSVEEDKIKLQTISYIFRFPIGQDNKKLLVNDIQTIYYPRLKETSPDIKKEETTIPKATPQETPPERNNYLINNIITSELACYEDIYKTFQDAVNQEELLDILWGVAKSLFYIGLPFLLNYAAENVAAKLKQIAKKTDKNLLECVLTDSENLKKLVIGSLDIIENPDITLQIIAKVPELPSVPALPVFDLEKELKRRVIEYILKTGIAQISKKVAAIIKPIQDMCNSDSYLSAFLNNAIPSLSSGEKLGIPSPAGLPVGVTSATYIPQIVTNINSLIDQSGIQTKENVYDLFRVNYFIDKKEYSNQEISDFFDFLGSDIDSGELLVLLKDKSTPDIRNLVLTFIRGYKVADSLEQDKFSKLFQDEKDIKFLFLFLGRYINYRLLMQQIAESLKSYTPSICVDVDSKFEDYSFKFGEDQTNAEAAELENILNDICSLKKPPLAIDILLNGPPLLTKTLDNALNVGFSSVVDSVENSKSQITLKKVDSSGKVLNLAAYEIPSIGIENFSKDLFDIGINIKEPENKISYYNLYLTSNKEELSESFAKEKEKFLDAITKNINDSFKKRKDVYKKAFNDQLKSSGNLGLKTDQNVFADYIEKYNSMKGTEVYKETRVEQTIEPSLKDFILGKGEKSLGISYFIYANTNSIFGNANTVEPTAGLPENYISLYNKLISLNKAISGLGTDEQKIFNIVDNMTTEEKCWMCYRTQAYDDGKSMMAAIESELSGNDLDTFYNKLKCKDRGYDTKVGNQGGLTNWKCK